MLLDDANGGQATTPENTFADAYLELLQRFKVKAIDTLDIYKAEATLEGDRVALLGALEGEVRGG